MSGHLLQGLLIKLKLSLKTGSIKFLYLIQWLFFKLTRYANHSRAFIDKYIDRPGVPNDEIQLYRQFSERGRKFAASMAVIYVIYATRNLACLYYTLKLVDYREPANNLVHRTNSSASYYEFACLTTNCSDPLINISSSGGGGHSAVSLADQLIALPLFSICQPRIKWLFAPFFSSPNVGLLYMAMFIIWLTVICVLYPLNKILIEPVDKHEGDKTLMFFTCPRAHLSLVRESLRQLLLTVTCSEVHYHQWALALEREISSLSQDDGHQVGKDDDDQQDSRWKHSASYERALDRLERLTKMDYHEMDSDTRDYIDDCLPINRTEWWRSRAFRVCLLGLRAALLVSTVVCTVVMLAYWRYHIDSDHRRALQLLEWANKSNCFISSSTTANLEASVDIRSGWNWYWTLETSLFMFSPLFVYVLSICYYFLIVRDEKVCILELSEQLRVAINFRALMKKAKVCRDVHLKQASRSGEGRQLKLLSAIRGRFMQRCQFKWGTFTWNAVDQLQRPITNRLYGELDDQQFAWQLMQMFGCHTDVYRELMDKIQINFMHFHTLLENNNKPITDMLTLSGIINYSYTLVGVYFFRSFKGNVGAPMVTICMGLASISGLICLASDIHSSLARLRTLIWTLIAEDIDINHCGESHYSGHKSLRCLPRNWLKRVSINSSDLAQKFHQLNITYMGIIKITLWTSTILTVALAR